MGEQKKRTGAIERHASGKIAAFVPTAEQRALVQNMAGIGCTHEEVLMCIPWGRPDGKPISKHTLHRHFRSELDRGKALANMKVKRSLFELTQAGNLGAICFYLKTQCGYRETLAVEATGKDGAPLAAAVMLYLPRKDEPADEQAERPERPASTVTAVVEPTRPALPAWPEPAAEKPTARVVGSIEPLHPLIARGF